MDCYCSRNDFVIVFIVINICIKKFISQFICVCVIALCMKTRFVEDVKGFVFRAVGNPEI